MNRSKDNLRDEEIRPETRRDFIQKLGQKLVHFSLLPIFGVGITKAAQATTVTGGGTVRGGASGPVGPASKGCAQLSGGEVGVEDSGGVACGAMSGGQAVQDMMCAALLPSGAKRADGDCGFLEPGLGSVSPDSDCATTSNVGTGSVNQDNSCVPGGVGGTDDVDCGLLSQGGTHQDEACATSTGYGGGTFSDGECGVTTGLADKDCGTMLSSILVNVDNSI